MVGKRFKQRFWGGVGLEWNYMSGWRRLTGDKQQKWVRDLLEGDWGS